MPGGCEGLKGYFRQFLGLICRNGGFGEAEPCALWPGSQCHRVGSAFSTSGIPRSICSFYLGSEGFSLAFPLSGYQGFFPKCPNSCWESLVRELHSFLTGQTPPYPQQWQWSPGQSLVANTVLIITIRYKLLLVPILIHVVNKHRLVGAHFNFLGGGGALSVKSLNSWC